MRVTSLERVESTNDEALRLAMEGAPLPLCVRAETQTGGRGRNGRAWTSPAGGVWLSAVGVGDGVVPASVVLRTAVAVVESITLAVPRDAHGRLRIKWPNDVLLDGKKVCGVLCEHRSLGDRSFVVVGVGLNADFEADLLPSDLRLPATTLRSALAQRIDGGLLASALVERLAGVLGRASEPLDEHERRAIDEVLAYRDEPVRLHALDGSTRDGRLLGVAPDGCALIGSGGGSWTAQAGDLDRLRAGT